MVKRIWALISILFLLNFISLGNCQEEDKSVLQNLTFDKKTGVISYELTMPARVRIRIGLADGPLCGTLVDWEKKQAGKHQEQWNGKDFSGIVTLLGREDIVFTFNYFTDGDEFLRDIQVKDILPLAGNLTGRHLPNLKVNQIHKDHIREFCHEPKINIKFLKKTRKTKDNYYIISKKTPIEISLDDEDMSWFRAERYSLHIFIDKVLLQGELDGYLPYTWIFNPDELNEGRYLVIVNLAGFEDHYGIASIPIYVKKK